MKRVMNGLGAALCAGALLATVGCDSIRDYSVNSYQGVMPINDFRPVASARMPDKPNPSVPLPPPEAAPAASASPSSDTTTKPADSSK